MRLLSYETPRVTLVLSIEGGHVTVDLRVRLAHQSDGFVLYHAIADRLARWVTP